MSILSCLVTVVRNMFFSITLYNGCLAWYKGVSKQVSPFIRRVFHQRLSYVPPVVRMHTRIFQLFPVCASQILWECIPNCGSKTESTEYFILTAFHTLSTPAFSTPAFSAPPPLFTTWQG